MEEKGGKEEDEDKDTKDKDKEIKEAQDRMKTRTT